MDGGHLAGLCPLPAPPLPPRVGDCAPCPSPPLPGWGAAHLACFTPGVGHACTLPLCPLHPGWGPVCPPGPSVPAGLSRADSGHLPSTASRGPGWICNDDHREDQRELGSSSEGRASKASVASRVWVRGLGPPARQQRWSEEDRPGPTLPSVSGDGRQHEARAKAGSPGQRWEERRAPLARLRTSEGRAGFWQNLPCGRTHGRAHRGSRCGWGACSRSRHSAGLSPPARAQRGGSWTPGPG